MNRKERRANERRLRKNKKREQSILIEDSFEVTKIAEDHYEIELTQAGFNEWVRDASYSDVFWMFAEDRIVALYEEANPGKKLETAIERRTHDGFMYPFVADLNPETLVGQTIEGDLTKKWMFIALLTHYHVGAFSLGKDFSHHELNSVNNARALCSYLNL